MSVRRCLRFGMYCWTVSGAGWLVLTYLTNIVEAGFTGIACLGMAAVFGVLSNEWS